MDDAHVKGIVGTDTTTTADGNIERPPQRSGHITCTTTGAGVVRSLSIDVLRHPEPLSLASLPCSSGWVYAGTPRHYVPACQRALGDGGSTRLLARAGDYVVTVVVNRRDRNWGGDAEAGLLISDQVTRRLDTFVPSPSSSSTDS